MLLDLDNWDKLPTQRLIYEDNYTNILMQSSGLGGGKSHGAVRKALQLSALNKGFSGGFLCPSYADYKRDIKPLFEDILEDHIGLRKNKHWWFHGTDKTYKFIWNKKPLFVFTAEKPIAGPNLAYCLINEFSLIPFERINEMLRRVRVKKAPCKQKVLVGTPEDLYGWLEDFVEKQDALNAEIPDNFKLYISDTDENPHNDPNYGKYLAGMLDPLQLRILKGGQIGQVGTNLFYYAFDIEKNRSTEEYDPFQTLYINIDFNVDNMHATMAHIFQRAGMKFTHFVDELVLKYNGADTYAMRKALTERYASHHGEIIVTVDASGRNKKTTGLSDVKVLREQFKNVRYKASGNDRLKHRQVLVNGLFNHKYLFINKDKCPTLWKDMRKVRQKPDFTKDDTAPDLVHASDTLDYLVMHEYQLQDRKQFNEYRAM